MTCAWFELLCRIPFSGLRLRLCRWHVAGCPRCRQVSDDGDALPPLLITAEQVPAGLDLRPAVKQGIDGLRPLPVSPAVVPLPARKSWPWAYAATMAALLVLGIWILTLDRHSSPRSKPSPIAAKPQTRLCSAKIGDRPARIILIQSQNPDRSIFWIARNNNRS